MPGLVLRLMMAWWRRPQFLVFDARHILAALGKRERMAASAIVTGTVHLGKPWYLSRKVWLAAIAFGVAIYCAITGKDLSPDQVAAHVETTATLLAPLITLILAVAHVDASERDLAKSMLETAKNLDKPEGA